MFKALESAAKRENRSHARQALEIILENIRRASEKDLPICQDTGFPGFLLDVGLFALKATMRPLGTRNPVQHIAALDRR